MPGRSVFGVRDDGQDPDDGQMAMYDRKLVAARLMRMLAFPRDSHDCGDLPPEDLDEVLWQFDGQIGRNWAREYQMDSSNPLDAFLDSIHQNTATALGPLGDSANEILARAAGFAERTRCSACGARPTACKGFASDIVHFRDGPENAGGRCLRLIRALVDFFTDRTERYLEAYGGSLNPRPLPQRIEIVVVPRKEGDRLLPLDAAIQFQGREKEAECAILTVRLPVGSAQVTGADFETLDYALLSLAYALFHEIFVHGAQGRAGPPVPKVEPTCAFTEGAVDTVAFDLLFEEMLADPTQLPEEVRPLGEAFRWQARRFHNRRFDWVQMPPSQAARLDSRDDRALRRRNFGRDYIYQPLVDIERQIPKRAGWARHCLIQLNLTLSAAERERLSELADSWTPPGSKGPTATQTALAGIIDSFLETGDSEAFLRRVEEMAC